MHLKSFLLIFGFPELNIFLKRWLLLSFLTLILALSLICIGFSEGTSHFLKEKMDNPFIRFVSVTVPASQAADPSFQVDLQKPVVKKRYQYDQLEMIATRMVNFRGINGKQPAAFVRHIKPGDELYKFLLQEPGVVLSDQVVPIENHPWSCIVTEAYLKKLGYSDFNVSYLDYIHPGVSDHFTPIPIAAIVKQLPDNHDLFVSDELFEAFEGTKENNLIDTAHSDHQTYLRAFIETELDEKQLKAKLNSDFPAALVERATETIKPGLMIRINNLEGLTPVQGYQKLALELKGDNIIRTFDFGRPVLSPKAYTDKIVFYFSQLDSIRPFQSYLLDKHKLKNRYEYH